MLFVLAPHVAPLSALPVEAHLDRFQMLQIAVDGLADGLMVITPEGEVVEANRRARQICHHLNQTADLPDAAQQLPTALWQNCRELLERGELRPGRHSLPEFELALDSEVNLRVRLRQIAVVGAQPASEPDFFYLLITLEERDRSTSEMRKYDLSEREMQVWKLRLQGYSYQDIAKKLYITVNTVKKHTKNILAKQRLLHDVAC